MSIRFTPSSMARLRTARAPSGSAGSPQTPLPVIRFAPKPRRFTVRSPPTAKVSMAAPLCPVPRSIKARSLYCLTILRVCPLLYTPGLDPPILNALSTRALQVA